MTTSFDFLPSSSADSGLRLLGDVTGIDLTTSGGYATQLLAGMGAGVNKIEKTGGDDSRAQRVSSDSFNSSLK